MDEHPEVEAVWAPHPSCERGYAFALNSSDDGRSIAYGSGKHVVARDTLDVNVATVAGGHKGQVTVARFSHDEGGLQVASGDAKGQVHLFKFQGNVLEPVKNMFGIGGRVYDICWYANDKGLAVVGDAKSKNGRVFTVSGNDQGSISATKRLTSCDIFFFDDDKKKITEAKLITTSDDFKMRGYRYKGGFELDESGVKAAKMTKNCNMARFSPDGKFVVVVGGKEIKLLDVEDTFQCCCEVKGDKKKGEHSGNIYAVAWTPDSSAFMTVSADKTAKLWSVSGSSFELSGSVDFKGESEFGEAVGDFQVGCCYVGDGIKHKFASLSLSGDIHYHSVQMEGDKFSLKLEQTVVGPTGEIVSLDVNRNAGTVAVVSSKGEVIVYDKTGFSKRVKGLKKPKSGAGVVNFGDIVLSAAWDDCVRSIDCESMKSSTRTLNFGEQPLGMRRHPDNEDFAVAFGKTRLVVIAKSSPESAFAELKAGAAEFTAAALSADGKLMAVGTSDKVVRLYSVGKGSVTATGVETDVLLDSAVSVTFNGDASLFCVGLAKKRVILFSSDDAKLLTKDWTKHSSTVNDVDFSPDGSLVVTGGGEGDIMVWDVSKLKSYKPVKHFRRAHLTGVKQVKFVDNTTFYSTGSYDGTTKRWSFSL